MDDETIRLTVPARPGFARVVRLAVTGLTARSGFSYDDVEDMRVAIGEVFSILVPTPGDDTRLSFTTRLVDDAIEVTGSRVPPSPIGELNPLSEQILAAVTDATDVDSTSGSVTLRKTLAG